MCKKPTAGAYPAARTAASVTPYMQEVAARGGRIILLSDQGEEENGGNGGEEEMVFARVGLPKMHSFINPLVYSLPVQLLAYHTAVYLGTDVDQPRNLAKSVTVE